MPETSGTDGGARLHQRLVILDALVLAFARRDRLFALLDGAATADDARTAVMQEFDLNEAQATAMLDLQVRRFAPTERQRVIAERAELRARLNAAD